MRKPQHISPSSLGLFYKDREEYYLKHLAEHRAPRTPQIPAAAAGSAFDAYVKSALHEIFFGVGADPQFEFETIFEDQVEEQNRDWARHMGQYIFENYTGTPAWDELIGMLAEAKEEPRFEFSAEGIIQGVKFLGKPDCRFVHRDGAHVILDWKVNGAASKYAKSPDKFYKCCYDAPNWPKPSRSHGKSHAKFVPMKHRGLDIHAGYLEDANKGWADQLSIYGWVLGEEVGDEDVVVCIDQVACKPTPLHDEPLLRFAQHRSRISQRFQIELMRRSRRMWEALESGHIFDDLSREESDEKCEQLEATAIGLQSDGSSLDEFFSECTRPTRFF